MPSAAVLNGTIALLSQQQQMASLGALFVVNAPSPGTGVAYAQLTAFSATANGLFGIVNGGQKTIYVQRLDMFETAAVATGTGLSFEAYVESGATAFSGGAARTPVGSNSGFAQTTGAVVTAFSAGAVTIPAAVGTRRLVGQGWIPTGVNVIKDSLTLDFGSDAPAAAKVGLTAARATDTARLTGQMPAFVIPPAWSGWINCWGWGTATPSFEYNLTYAEL